MGPSISIRGGCVLCPTSTQVLTNFYLEKIDCYLVNWQTTSKSIVCILVLVRLHIVFIFWTEKPQPLEIKELTVGGNSLTLTWDDASPKTRLYLLQYRIIGSGSVWKVIQVPSANHQYELIGLNPDTSYEVGVWYLLVSTIFRCNYASL